jgi:hypothetical protein
LEWIDEYKSKKVNYSYSPYKTIQRSNKTKTDKGKTKERDKNKDDERQEKRAKGQVTEQDIR